MFARLRGNNLAASLATIAVGVFTLLVPADAQGQGAAIWGTVKDGNTELPLAADISIAHLEGSHTQLFHARAGANGFYQVSSLPAGKKLLIVRAEGFGFAVKEIALQAWQFRGPVNFELEKAASLRGLVVDEQDVPIPGAKVRVVYPDAPPVVFGWQMNETLTNAAGEFHVKNITPNRKFYLEARHRQFPVRFSAVPLRLAPAQERFSLRLELRRGLSLSGQIVDLTGTPVVDAEVRLIARQLPVPDPTGGKSFGLQQETHRKARTDSEGKFVFEGVGNGTRLLVVRHPKYEPVREELHLNRVLASTVRLQRLVVEVALQPKS